MANVEDIPKRSTADPLPYIIVFAILFLILLVVLTWTLDVWYKSNQCVLFPNFWCSDNWRCNNTCPTGNTGNICYQSDSPTGLASCLGGPNSIAGQLCFTTPTSETGTSCDCTPGMSNTNSCFSGCAASFDDITEGAPCCCCPGQQGCPYTADTLPTSCNYKGVCNDVQ